MISIVQLFSRNISYSSSLPLSNQLPLEMLEATALEYGELDDIARSRLRLWLVEPALVYSYFAKCQRPLIISVKEYKMPNEVICSFATYFTIK